jgi:hypothetical protein
VLVDGGGFVMGQALLWVLFALLWVALVLVVVTARRGPWQKPPTRTINKATLHSVSFDPHGMGAMWTVDEDEWS